MPGLLLACTERQKAQARRRPAYRDGLGRICDEESIAAVLDSDEPRSISENALASKDDRDQKRDQSGLSHALSYRSYQWPIWVNRKKADEIIAQLSGLRKQILDVIPNLRYLLFSGAQCPVRGDHPVRVFYLLRHRPL
jgi:hypothetical protein